METVIKEELDLFQPELIIKEEKDEMSMDSSGYYSTGSPPDQMDEEMPLTPEELFSGCENTESFKCQACDMKFATGRALKNHKTVKHTSAQFKCKECQNPYRTAKCLRAHIKKAHLDLWEKEYNGKRFTAEQLSEKNTEKDSKGDSENTFDKDMADLNNYWPCQTCSKIFPSLPTLTKHAEIHNKVEGMLKMLQNSFGDGPSESSQTPSQKTKILKTPVSNKVVVKQEPSLSKGFNCQQCDKTFETIVTLNTHAEIHSKAEGMLKMLQQNFDGGPSESKQKASQKAEAYKAAVCTKKLIKSEPNIPKRFSCQQCDKTFEQKHFLKIHNKINHVKKIALKVKEAAVSIKSEPQYFTCLECDKTFESAKHLKIHDKINHAKLTSQLIKKEPRALADNCFQCSQCDKTFANPTYLKIHVTMKHKNKDSSEQINSDPQNEIKTEPEDSANNCFQCLECDRNFASRVHLKIHVTMKHTTVSQNDSSAEVNSDIQENSLMQSKVVPNEPIQQIKSDPQDKPVNCSLCDKTFADPKFLKIHFTMKHTTDSQKDSSSVTNSDPLDKPYPCS